MLRDKMHELAITRQIIGIILDEAGKAGLKTVSGSTIELGQLTSYKKEPLLFYFDSLKAGSDIIRGAKLLVREVPARIRCNGCGKKSRLEDTTLILCPFCDSSDVEVIQGKDIKIIEISGD